MGALDVWYLHAYPGRDNPLARIDPKSKAIFTKTVGKALRTDNRTLLPKVADQDRGGKWSFRNDPPILSVATISGRRADKGLVFSSFSHDPHGAF